MTLWNWRDVTSPFWSSGYCKLN